MKIILYCNSINQLNFFIRVAKTLETMGYSIIFWSNRLSVVIKAKNKGYQAVLLQGKNKSKDYSISIKYNPNEAFDLENSLISYDRTLAQIQKCAYSIEQFIKVYEPSYIFIWNGANQICQTIYDIGINYKIEFLFFDIGNFPNKLFVDPNGITSNSWYFNNKNKLRNLDIDLNEFFKWKENYIDMKRKSHIVPQAKKIHKFNFNYLYDLFGFYFLGAITIEKTRPIWKIIDYLKRRFYKIKFDDFDYINEKYILFPIQVSTDSQILWNANLSIEEALLKALKTANEMGIDLIVKPHPAEPHWSAINKILKLREKYGFKLVNENIFLLIENCEKLITINSTAGLEAMLLNKPVEIYGKALYSDFDELDMAIYINYYLLDIDFFSNTPLTVEQIELIMKRANFLNNSLEQ